MIDIGLVTELFRLHAPRLVLYARQWLDRPAAEDVVQEVFVRLMAQAAIPRQAAAWLYRSTRNAAISVMRSGRRRGAREHAVVEMRQTWFDPRPNDPLDAADAQEALETLPRDQREVVVLRIWAQMSFHDIAELTAAPLSTVYDRYRAGLAGIRTRLESSCQKQDRT